MFTSCQEELLTELKRRIAHGRTGEILPPAARLAEEFGVNIKTVNKALNRLAAAGLVERRRRVGTVIRPNANGAPDGSRMIEIIFSGFTAPFLHPFWSEVLEGAHEVFNASGCRIILNHIVADPETHLFDINAMSLSDAAGRVVVGPGEKWLLDRIAASRRPMVCAGDEIFDPAVPQVCFDFFRGVNDAVEYLARRRQCRKIGFIGHVEAWINPGILQKFNAYVYAVQRFMPVDRTLVEGCWPRPEEGRAAIERLLDRTRPDSLIVGTDMLVPEICAVLEARGITIPVVGCDGVRLDRVPADYHAIFAPRRECGRRSAELLLGAIDNGEKIGRHALEAEFRQ
ncbi:MAG: LacI family DNA-binding transcriptional regulator [Lentisphaeria bacterium]|nr:LacI family DNA-binding transcriptional regulator [Lentisphaeria bacterium]